RFGEPAPSLNLAPIDRLLAWCGDNVERVQFVARNVRAYESTTGVQEDEDSPSPVRLSEHFKRLLAVMPDKSTLVEIAVDQAVPTSWMDSRAPLIGTRQRALRELLSHESPEVRALVAEKLALLDSQLDAERTREESEHHGREQRFE